MLAITVPVYIVFADMPVTEVTGIIDTDGDGVMDDKDFEDFGNGGVDVQVTSFHGECGNWLGPCKPRFEVLVDADFDGDYETSRGSGTLVGNLHTNAFGAVFDIPDDATKIRVELRITDSDGDDPIDWTSSQQGRWGYVEVGLPTSPRSWSESGTLVARGSVSFTLTVLRI